MLLTKKIRDLSRSFLLPILLCPFPVLAADYVIHAGRLIDGESSTPREEVSIIIAGNTIQAVNSGYIPPQGEQQLLDLTAYTVMPGLMDMHVHIIAERPAKPLPDSYTERYRKNDADFALRATRHAKTTLLAGFTTVRDLGGGSVSLSLRNAINAGYVDGPRIFAAGTIIATTGGHADPTNGLNNELAALKGEPGPKEGVINGSDEARRAIRQRYKDGSDVIKLTVTGGVMSLAKSADNPQFMADELDAIMAAAKDYDFTVAVHAHGAEGMKRAVTAGVDSVEHGTYMTESIMKLMKKQGTYLVPTISAGKWVADHADNYAAVVQPKARAVGPKMQSTFASAYQKGVKIAFGTDAGIFPHGLNAKEFVYMTDAGMPPMAAIQSATIEAAKLLRMDKTLGSIAPGKIADIIAVKGNPLDDIGLMSQVRFVMKDGAVYQHPSAPNKPADKH